MTHNIAMYGEKMKTHKSLWHRWLGVFLFLSAGFATGGCTNSSDCTESYNPTTVNTLGRPCTQHCDCNNQLFEGYCVGGSCITVSRGKCDEPGSRESCFVKAPFVGTLNCKQGQRVCQPPGLQQGVWGNCTCSSANDETNTEPAPEPTETSTEPTPEPLEEPAQDASTVEAIQDAPMGREAGPEPVEPKESGPETNPNDISKECNSGETRPCYPPGQRGCTPNGKTFTCQGACTAGTESCENNRWSGACKQAVTPTTERCNDSDDDCNGKTDENLPGCLQHCKTGTDCPIEFSTCQGGRCYRKCQKNDTCPDTFRCDTNIGFCVPCPAGTKRSEQEKCNGQDDNCNQQVDESFPESKQACNVPNQQGECLKGTYTACAQGKLVCTGPSKTAEACDGKDNDCDGQIDNGYQEKGKACSITQQLGECAKGTYSGCSQGTLSCTGPSPQKEVCDGKDNNCDGSTDEDFLWAKVIPTAIIHASAFDTQGNTYISGVFRKTLTLGSTTLTPPCRSTYIGFVAKFDRFGKALWVQPIQCFNNGQGTSTAYGDPSLIALGPNNDVYIAGYFSGRITLGSLSLTGQSADVFIARLNNKGVFQQAWLAVATLNAKGRSVNPESLNVDSTGNAYLAGTFGGGLLIDGKSLYGSQEPHLWVSKFTPQGKSLWNIKAGPVYLDHAAIDSRGNVFLVGGSRNSAPITFGSATLTAKTNRDIFVAKINSSGAWQWVKQAGTKDQNYIYHVTTDSQGDAYLSGVFTETITLGSLTLKPKLSGTVHNKRYLFVSKIDAKGNFVWANSSSGHPGRLHNKQTLSLDSSGNIYVATWNNSGAQTGTMHFGSFTFPSQTPSLLVGKLDTKGKFLWVKHAPATKNINSVSLRVHGLAVTPDPSLIVAGTFSRENLKVGNLVLSGWQTDGSGYILKVPTTAKWTCP